MVTLGIVSYSHIVEVSLQEHLYLIYRSINSIVYVVVFMIFLSLDVRNALKRKAHWFPGHALFLTALTIQLLSFIDNSDSSVNLNNTDIINSFW